MPTIGGEFGKRGLFYGSGRREAEMDSAESLMDVLSRGRVENERYGREQQLGAIDQSLAGMLNMTNMGLTAGEIPRRIEQEKLTADKEDWLRTQPGAINPAMQTLVQLLGGGPMSPTQYISKPDPFSSGLETFANLANAYSKFKSPNTNTISFKYNN